MTRLSIRMGGVDHAFTDSQTRTVNAAYFIFSFVFLQQINISFLAALFSFQKPV